ncbi:hypothetical protein [Halorubrum sp. GN11GM_10-3_MGM]|uniref:hypothetical protein n=1 Tax=Halorubrum sp. GN11GM_10-3_MGM TaxID=2518111 RepID=UPI0010F97075|nr:hypothetical protein [Halorubrum sp. GN11GM_10-3_MGM]TKX71865.1 hypothetical protein EXE40_06635 [Halorubrum sp. GN11GM_10-3_MGM]
MSHRSPTTTRRTVIATIAAGGLGTVGGCTDTGAGATDSGALSNVTVDGTSLVVEYDSETSATGLAVIAPSGEAFAERELTPGASRETIPIGTAYPPGTYTVQLVEGQRVVAATEQSLRPDVVIRELKLGRNHPEEMFEGAGSFTITSEVIVTIENRGTGPEKLTKLLFSGDVPRPTPDQLSGSGIMAVKRPVRYTKVTVTPGETHTLYSGTSPFGPNSGVVSCTPEGTSGQFTVGIEGNVVGELTEQKYDVAYQGEDLTDCQITIERVDK